MTEKRKALRIPVSMRVDCQGIDPIAFGYAHNFSLSGMALSVQYQNHDDFSLEPPVVLKFILPGSAVALDMKAKIIRVSKGQENNIILGLRFVDPSETAQKELTFFIATQSQDNPIQA